MESKDITRRCPKTNEILEYFYVAAFRLHYGEKVGRLSWGSDVFVFRVPDNKYPAERNKSQTLIGIYEDDMVPYSSYMAMKKKNGEVMPWTPSQEDFFADDWIALGT